MLQPLLLLKQSMEVAYDPDPLLLDGPHVAFTSLGQFLSKGRTKTSQVDQFEVVLGAPSTDSEFESESESILKVDVRFLFKRTKPRAESLSAQVMVRSAAGARWITLDLASEKALRRLSRFSSGLQVLNEHRDSLRHEVVWFEDNGEFTIISNTEALEWARTILHLPGHRGHRERRYPISKVTRDRAGGVSVVGPMTPYAASLLSEWKKQVRDRAAKESSKRRARESLAIVMDGLKRLGLSWKVAAVAANAAELELRVGRLPKPQQGGAQDFVDIADVGFGVSQVLPVLVALAAALPGQLVLIEQPELHLHPRGQLAMGRLLAEAAERGVIVVVETHSQLILRALQTVVARGELPSEDVGLHWFSRDPETGWSTVTLAELHDDGTFGDWPVDFPDVFAMADQDFIDAVFGDDE